MWVCLRRLCVALAIALAGCGDGVFIISVNSGVIVGSPRCAGSGGDFQLRNTGGLVVLVVITSTTDIVVSGGGSGSCSDLSADAPVEVAGRESGERIIATSITLQ